MRAHHVWSEAQTMLLLLLQRLHEAHLLMLHLRNKTLLLLLLLLSPEMLMVLLGSPLLLHHLGRRSAGARDHLRDISHLPIRHHCGHISHLLLLLLLLTLL